MAKIRKGDLVQIISGPKTKNDKPYRGAQGEVLEVLVDEQRVIVQGLNLTTRHLRPAQTAAGVRPAGVELVESPIHVSNVALVNPETNQAARVGFEEKTVTDNGVTRVVRERVFKPSRREPQAAPEAKGKSKKKTAKTAKEKDAE